MILEADAHAAWRDHIARYCVCQRCGGDGEYEGAMNTVDPQKPGDPVLLREVVECPGCGHRWYEVWQYSGQAPISDDAT